MSKKKTAKNAKIEGDKYKYIHSMDCFVYVTFCLNCKQEVGGWTPEEADKKWSEHFCEKKTKSK